MPEKTILLFYFDTAFLASFFFLMYVWHFQRQTDHSFSPIVRKFEQWIIERWRQPSKPLTWWHKFWSTILCLDPQKSLKKPCRKCHRKPAILFRIVHSRPADCYQRENVLHCEMSQLLVISREIRNRSSRHFCSSTNMRKEPPPRPVTEGGWLLLNVASTVVSF